MVSKSENTSIAAQRSWQLMTPAQKVTLKSLKKRKKEIVHG